MSYFITFGKGEQEGHGRPVFVSADPDISINPFKEKIEAGEYTVLQFFLKDHAQYVVDHGIYEFIAADYKVVH